METFRHTIEVRWADCDANHHARHSAYADFCTHVRVEWLRVHGFGFDQFQTLAFGPVIFQESTEYLKEVRMNERIQITVRTAALSADGSRYRIRHDVFKEDGRLAARHEISGAWMDLRARKLIPPPAALAAIFDTLERTEDYQGLAQQACRTDQAPERAATGAT